MTTLYLDTLADDSAPICISTTRCPCGVYHITDENGENVTDCHQPTPTDYPTDTGENR